MSGIVVGRGGAFTSRCRRCHMRCHYDWVVWTLQQDDGNRLTSCTEEYLSWREMQITLGRAKKTKRRWKRRAKENSIARTREHEGNKPGRRKTWSENARARRREPETFTGRTRHTPLSPRFGLTPHAWTLRVPDCNVEIACGALHRSMPAMVLDAFSMPSRICADSGK